MTTSLPTAVLWDMDGTLVDTEPYWFQAEFALVDEHGNGSWNLDLATQMIGSDLLDSAAFMIEHAGVKLAPRAIVDFLLERVIEQLSNNIPWQPGARELLAGLVTAGVPCGLVTMSWRPFADAVLQQLPGMFAISITGDEVPEGRGKPHPDPYLLGARELGVSPSDCVAIEDSLTGVRSAVAAGCQVLGVPNKHITLPEESATLTIVPSLADVTPRDLAQLGQPH